MNFLNVVVVDKAKWSDVEALFPWNEEIFFISAGTFDMADLLVKIEAFPSKSQARKNWKGSLELPPGWSEFWIGKKKRQICIWNPTER